MCSVEVGKLGTRGCRMAGPAADGAESQSITPDNNALHCHALYGWTRSPISDDRRYVRPGVKREAWLKKKEWQCQVMLRCASELPEMVESTKVDHRPWPAPLCLVVLHNHHNRPLQFLHGSDISTLNMVLIALLDLLLELVKRHLFVLNH